MHCCCTLATWCATKISLFIGASVAWKVEHCVYARPFGALDYGLSLRTSCTRNALTSLCDNLLSARFICICMYTEQKFCKRCLEKTSWSKNYYPFIRSVFIFIQIWKMIEDHCKWQRRIDWFEMRIKVNFTNNLFYTTYISIAQW